MKILIQSRYNRCMKIKNCLTCNTKPVVSFERIGFLFSGSETDDRPWFWKFECLCKDKTLWFPREEGNNNDKAIESYNKARRSLSPQVKAKDIEITMQIDQENEVSFSVDTDVIDWKEKVKEVMPLLTNKLSEFIK